MWLDLVVARHRLRSLSVMVSQVLQRAGHQKGTGPEVFRGMMCRTLLGLQYLKVKVAPYVAGSPRKFCDGKIPGKLSKDWLT